MLFHSVTVLVDLLQVAHIQIAGKLGRSCQVQKMSEGCHLLPFRVLSWKLGRKIAVRSPLIWVLRSISCLWESCLSSVPFQNSDPPISHFHPALCFAYPVLSPSEKMRALLKTHFMDFGLLVIRARDLLRMGEGRRIVAYARIILQSSKFWVCLLEWRVRVSHGYWKAPGSTELPRHTWCIFPTRGCPLGLVWEEGSAEWRQGPTPSELRCVPHAHVVSSEMTFCRSVFSFFLFFSLLHFS